jgi:integrase
VLCRTELQPRENPALTLGFRVRLRAGSLSRTLAQRLTLLDPGMDTATELGQITTLADHGNSTYERRGSHRPPSTTTPRRWNGFAAFLNPGDAHRRHQLTREHVEAFIVHLLDTRSPATAVNRYKALQQFFRWLDDEGEITGSPMAKMSPPKLDEVEIPVVSLDDLRKLLDVCKGNTSMTVVTPP